jgi:hypothetical protein
MMVCACALLAASSTRADPKTITYPPDSVLVCPASVSRTSPQKDSHGRFHPPWTSVTVSAICKRAVAIGQTVTIVPLRRDLPLQELKVSAVKEQAAVDEYPASWVVDIEVSGKAFFAATPDAGRGDDSPFDVLVISPAKTNARLLPSTTVARDLPKGKGASARTLWAAVDLDGDGKVDAAIFRFCCEKPSRPWRFAGPNSCDYHCERTYLRQSGSGWTLVDEGVGD